MYKRAIKTHFNGLDPEAPIFPAVTVAGILNISVKELKKLVDEGILAPVQKSSKRGLYCPNDIETGKFINYLSQYLGINLIGSKIILYMLREKNIALENYRDYIENIKEGGQKHLSEDEPIPESDVETVIRNRS